MRPLSDAYLKRYGLTTSRYNAILAIQGGGCAICGRKREDKDRNLSVDHDHESGDVRGILCLRCNSGIGKLQENPRLLRKAADYVERHALRSVFVHDNSDVA